MTSSDVLSDLLTAKGYALADGAMGTQLFDMGLKAGDPPEAWNVDCPADIQAVHRSYLRAGADIVLTNSFGGNRFRLALHGLSRRAVELNEAAARNARLAAEEESERAARPVLVAGSMGPTGELLKPMGAMTASACEAAFAEQAAGLTAGGADLLWIETMSDLREVEAAVRGARSTSDLPVAATMSFDTAGRTMMGTTGAEMGRRLRGLGLAAMGANCGNNLIDTEAAVTAISSAAAERGVAVISKPNAGVPVWSDDALVYDGTPQVMAAHAMRILAAGATVIGACCGSTPAHIAKIAAVLRGDEPAPELGASDLSSGPVAPRRRAAVRRRGRTRRRRRD